MSGSHLIFPIVMTFSSCEIHRIFGHHFILDIQPLGFFNLLRGGSGGYDHLHSLYLHAAQAVMISGYDHLEQMIISGNSLTSGLSDILNIKYLCSSLTYYRFDINKVYCPFLCTYVVISTDVGVQHQHHVPSCPFADGDPCPGGHGGHHVRVLRGHHHCLLRHPHGLAL